MSIKAWQEDGAPDGWQVDVSIGKSRADGIARRIVTEAMLFAGALLDVPPGDQSRRGLSYHGR